MYIFDFCLRIKKNQHKCQNEVSFILTQINSSLVCSQFSSLKTPSIKVCCRGGGRVLHMAATHLKPGTSCKINGLDSLDMHSSKAENCPVLDG